MSSLSCGQLHILRKLALLRLTACMERYCPSHKSGWNWELPKIIRKIKTPDYKGKLTIQYLHCPLSYMGYTRSTNSPDKVSVKIFKHGGLG